MSVTGKVIMGLAALALASGAGLVATLPAGAATPACGTGCMTWFNQDFGNGFAAAVPGGAAVKGRHVRLAAAADSATEDFQITFEGAAGDLVAQGLVSPQVAALFGQDLAVEVQYTPGGVTSGLCIGLAAADRAGEQVSLQRCGRSSKTIWVADQADQVGRFGPLVAASDTSSAADLVLTGSATGQALTVTHVSVSSGAIASDQMWQALYGLLT